MEMIVIRVTSRGGETREIRGAAGARLMEVLRAHDFDVAGTCGGMCSCGTCHVYVAADWVARLAPPEEEESDMIEALADVVEVSAASRLSCQIVLGEAMDGLTLEIAPQF